MALVLILLPIVVGCALFFIPRTDRRLSRTIGCIVAAVTFFLPLAIGSDGTFAGHWLSRPFIASLHFAWGGLSLWLVLLLALCTFCAVLATNMAQTRTMVALLLMLEGTMMGLFTARDILAFALFWDLMLIPPFFALVGWGEHRETAWRYLIYNFSGGLLLLLATAAFGVIYGSTDVIGTSAHPLIGGWAAWIFAGFAVAFAVKTPLFPLHTWMPATYVDSPPAMVSVVSSVQSKAGLYGLLVITLPFMPSAMMQWRWIFIVAALVSLLYGAFIALVQTDSKRIVAYSSLSHLGLIVLAIFSFNPVALQGAVVYIIAHGLFSAALFLVLGYIEQREDTRSLTRLGGLGRANPMLAGAFTIAALAALGLPGLAGFVGELVILSGVFKSGYFWPALIALIPIVIASAYMLRLLQDVINGPPVNDIPQRRDLTWLEGLAIAPLLAALVIVGVYPHALTSTVALRQAQGDKTLGQAQGDITLRQAQGDITLRQAQGDITLREAQGDIALREAQGDIALRQAQGDKTLRQAQGDIALRQAQGDIALRQAQGDIALRQAQGDIALRQAQGDIALRQAQGDITLRQAQGDITLRQAQGDKTLRQAQDDITRRQAQGDKTLRQAQGDKTLQQAQGDKTLRQAQGDKTLRQAQGDIEQAPDDNRDR